MISEIFSGLVQHNRFIFFNTYIHAFAGVFIATALYTFLSKVFKERWHYFTVIFFPAVFGSVFPDLIFILSTYIEQRSLDGMFFLLTHGGDVHSTFHFHFPLVLVAPTTLFFVLVMNRIVKKSYFDHLPKWAFALICVLSLAAAFFHIYMDLVGF